MDLAGFGDPVPSTWPSVCAVVPARNEAPILPHALPSLLAQDYPGQFHVILVDDQSQDGTAATAKDIARNAQRPDQLTIISSQPLAPGWTGKLWAMHQGVLASLPRNPDYLLLTDADIAYAPGCVRALVGKAIREQRSLVSLMAHLKIEGNWDRLLIPAFVYFFAKLYPFRWVNDPMRKTAAAAGGCILIRRDTLHDSPGLPAIRNEVIDDCALARLVKHETVGRERPGTRGQCIWLGLSRDVRSVRGYGGLRGIWHMVSRTAFHQLRYSPALLLGTVVAMLVVYGGPVVSGLGGVLLLASGAPASSTVPSAILGFLGWLLMGLTYAPMVRWYGFTRVWAALLPLAALGYTLMTVDSAVQTWRGRGASWKGRTYAPR
jgi:hopene-associated glycosyltransferase HpnB